VNSIPVADLAIENIEATYIAFGTTAGSTARFEYSGLQVMLGPTDHPLANFALIRSLDRQGLEALRLAARQRRSLHVYLLAQEGNIDAFETLEVAGFQPSYTLEKMISLPGQTQSLAFAPIPANDESERLRVSRFMMTHFFGSRPRGFREMTATTVARSASMELYYVPDRGRIVGAVMLSRSPGVIGLYNLCVAIEKRDRGLGSQIVAWARTLARAEGVELTLQCRSALLPWYSARGFAPVGRMETFLASEQAALVTM
jgi:hypothetical protein